MLSCSFEKGKSIYPLQDSGAYVTTFQLDGLLSGGGGTWPTGGHMSLHDSAKVEFLYITQK
jgi:hypothetical protein